MLFRQVPREERRHELIGSCLRFGNLRLVCRIAPVQSLEELVTSVVRHRGKRSLTIAFIAVVEEKNEHLLRGERVVEGFARLGLQVGQRLLQRPEDLVELHGVLGLELFFLRNALVGGIDEELGEESFPSAFERRHDASRSRMHEAEAFDHLGEAL